MEQTLYRRPLPSDAIAFSSSEGRQLFAEALAAGGLDGYFPLAEQFHTQSEPEYCGLGSLVVALNALAIDPGRLWKGPWRWFSEELLDCCVPLSVIRERGLAFDELACLARCNGAEVEAVRANGGNLEAWRDALRASSCAGTVVIVSYDRAAMGQTGSGHFSPIGGYHAARDLVLVLDVARFKYPPHWVPAERLWQAMQSIDPASGLPRGWLTLRPRSGGMALGYSVNCSGEVGADLARRVKLAVADLGPAADVPALARAILPLVAHIEVRMPSAGPHQAALEVARAALRETPAYAQVTSALGEEHAEVVTVLLLASIDLLLPEQRPKLVASLGSLPEASPLAAEITNLRAQLAALWEHARAAERAQA